jgi:hypothetical protein
MAPTDSAVPGDITAIPTAAEVEVKKVSVEVKKKNN